MDNLSKHSAEMHAGDVAEALKEHPELSHHNSDGNMAPSDVGNITGQTSIPLADESISDIQDEFLCYDEHGNPNTELWSFIPPDTLAAKIWGSCLDLFMAYMDTTGIDWQALHLGTINQKPHIAIFYSTDGEWNKTAITAELRTRFFPEHVFPILQFWKGKAEKACEMAFCEEDGYCKVPICGAGIGAEGLDRPSGTLGCYLRPDDHRFYFRYGLTCHHVLCPTKNSESENNRRALSLQAENYLKPAKDSESLNYTCKSHEPRGADPKVNIMQPSCYDHFWRVGLFKRDLEHYEKGFHNAIQQYAILKDNKSLSRINYFQKEISKTTSRLDKLFNFSRLLGTLEASSGYRVDIDSGNSLDWALFSLGDDYRVPLWNKFHLWDRKKFRKGWKKPISFRVKAIADPVPGEEVVRYGRRTGRTFGFINGVKESVNIQENGRSTKEWQIINVDREEFSDSGDSGSLILNKKFEAVGILTGLCSSSMFNGLVNKAYMCHCQTYFTPIKMILDDIKTLTGKDLILWP